MISKVFKICDIDFNELKNQEIKSDFFDDYQNTRIVNSFLFNFSKLQDKIGAKLFRKALYELKEIDNQNLSMIDILNLLERLNILKNVEDWDRLREIRNSLSHEYPFDTGERVANISLALDGYQVLKDIYKQLQSFYLEKM